MGDSGVRREHEKPTWWWRVGILVAVVVALFTSSLAAGAAGTFSAATSRLGRNLADPSTRGAAAAALADQFAVDFAGNHPTLPGTRDEHACPAPYAARASSIIGALAPADAASLLQSAARRLSATRWRVSQAQVGSGLSQVSGHNRRGIDVVVSEQAGDQLTSIQVTVTVACPASAASTTTSSAIATSAAAGG